MNAKLLLPSSVEFLEKKYPLVGYVVFGCWGDGNWKFLGLHKSHEEANRIVANLPSCYKNSVIIFVDTTKKTG